MQGSAADLVKMAMVKVETALCEAWPRCRPLRWCHSRKEDWTENPETTGAWLCLQLHDELIYEVSGEDVVQAAQMLKKGMETALPLLVPTPVRLKVGASWGTLREFNL